MASAADKAEQRVHEQRRLIEQKLTRLEARVKDDISAARTASRERTSTVVDSLPGRHQIERQVEQRPLTTVAAGLAAGIGLGMLSESVSIRGNGSSDGRGPYDGRMNHQRTDESSSNGAISGMISRLTGPATVAILGPIQDQLQEFVSSALAGLSGSGQSQRSGEHPEGQMPAAAGARPGPSGSDPSRPDQAG